MTYEETRKHFEREVQRVLDSRELKCGFKITKRPDQQGWEATIHGVPEEDRTSLTMEVRGIEARAHGGILAAFPD